VARANPHQAGAATVSKMASAEADQISFISPPFSG
jgi:hypothetical protein